MYIYQLENKMNQKKIPFTRRSEFEKVCYVSGLCIIGRHAFVTVEKKNHKSGLLEFSYITFSKNH